jgi:hypothetical protein
LELDPSVLYRLAALPDELVATLTPDTLLTDPRTGRKTALREMSAIGSGPRRARGQTDAG